MIFYDNYLSRVKKEIEYRNDFEIAKRFPLYICKLKK